MPDLRWISTIGFFKVTDFLQASSPRTKRTRSIIHCKAFVKQKKNVESRDREHYGWEIYVVWWVSSLSWPPRRSTAWTKQWWRSVVQRKRGILERMYCRTVVPPGLQLPAAPPPAALEVEPPWQPWFPALTGELGPPAAVVVLWLSEDCSTTYSWSSPLEDTAAVICGVDLDRDLIPWPPPAHFSSSTHPLLHSSVDCILASRSPQYRHCSTSQHCSVCARYQQLRDPRVPAGNYPEQQQLLVVSRCNNEQMPSKLDIVIVSKTVSQTHGRTGNPAPPWISKFTVVDNQSKPKSKSRSFLQEKSKLGSTKKRSTVEVWRTLLNAKRIIRADERIYGEGSRCETRIEKRAANASTLRFCGSKFRSTDPCTADHKKERKKERQRRPSTADQRMKSIS